MPTLMLKDVRTSFFNGFTAQENKNDDGTVSRSFNSDFIIPKDHPQVKAIQAAIKTAAKEKWGDKSDTVLKVLNQQNRICFRDGDTKIDKDGEVREGYAGNHYFRASNKVRPVIFDRDKSPLVEEDGRPYSGCYVIVKVDFWAQDHPKGGRRINATMMGVQFLRDGEAFGGGGKVASADEFDVIDGLDDDDSGDLGGDDFLD